MNEDTKKMVGWGIVALVVVGIFVGLVMMSNSKTSTPAVTKPPITTPVSGTSPVNEEGKVVTAEGKEVKNNVTPGAVEAPKSSNPVAVVDIPPSAIKLQVTSGGFTPSSFEVKAGSAVTLSVTSGDTQTHIFMFNDASLSAVALGLGPQETRMITFNAPAKGEYAFRCDVPGHTGRGETGKMIVK
ncbi:MAG: cupredoxin domain-containing protein [Candidatus Paceibacterota bacterium]|jgi:uncharacterized cupredoxin-like copper-binding protein